MPCDPCSAQVGYVLPETGPSRVTVGPTRSGRARDDTAGPGGHVNPSEVDGLTGSLPPPPPGPPAGHVFTNPVLFIRASSHSSARDRDAPADTGGRSADTGPTRATGPGPAKRRGASLMSPQCVGVVGAGVIGSGVAQLFANGSRGRSDRQPRGTAREGPPHDHAGAPARALPPEGSGRTRGGDGTTAVFLHY